MTTNAADRHVRMEALMRTLATRCNGSVCSPLVMAARDGDFARVEQLLICKPNAVADKDSDAGTTDKNAALMSAVCAGHAAVVDLLARHGASVCARDANARTPLSAAASLGHTDVIDVLLRRGAAAVTNGSAGSALIAAARAGHVSALTSLLASSNVSANETEDGNAALHFAAQSGSTAAVQLLLEHGACINALAQRGESALALAIQAGHVDVVRALLARGALAPPATALLPNGDSLLHLAAAGGHDAIVRELLACGLDVDAVKTDGGTPLHVAARLGHTTAAAVLLDAGAAIDGKRIDGRSPLHSAAFDDHAAVAALLLARGADAVGTNPLGETPLLVAAREGCCAVAPLLLSHADAVQTLERRRLDGYTALLAAADRAHCDVVALLLEAGASVDAEDITRGETALHIAVQRSACGVVEVLLACGANANRLRRDGNAPLHVAAAVGDLAIARALLASGADVHAHNHNGDTALHITCRGGHSELLHVLRAFGASIDCVNAQFETPLLVAGRVARTGQIHLLERLVADAQTVNVCALDGETPLLSAARHNRRDLVLLLIARAGTSALLARESPLLPTSLETMAQQCGQTREFAPLFVHVIARLNDASAQLATQACDSDSLPERTLVALTKIVFAVCTLQVAAAAKSDLVARLIASRSFQSAVQDVHTEIEHFMRTHRLATDADAMHGDWVDRLHADYATVLAALLDSITVDVDALRESACADADPRKTLALLQYELVRCSERANPLEAALMATAVDRVAQHAGLAALPLPPPIWFVPRHELEFEDLARAQDQRVATKRHGKWRHAVVMISECVVSQRAFVQRASAWAELSHPNVVKLYGAYHLTPPFVFAHEPSTGGTLRRLVRGRSKQRALWQLLYEAALGLQYLHERGVAHGALTCETIIIGASGIAKIGGFELLATADEPEDGADGAVECDLQQPTAAVLRKRAADVYAFAMCIAEAVTGKDPWNRVAAGRAYASSTQAIGVALERVPPACRSVMSAPQLGLLAAMCVADPTARAPITVVVQQLCVFARQEREAQRSPSRNNDGLEGSETPDATASYSDSATAAAAVALREFIVPEFAATIDNALQTLALQCAALPDSQQTAQHVHARLTDIYRLLLAKHRRVGDADVARFCSLLLRFQRFVRTPVSDQSAVRIVKSRRAATVGHTFHIELDRLLEVLGASERDAVHSWQTRSWRSGHGSQNNSSHSSDAPTLSCSSDPGAIDSVGVSECGDVDSTHSYNSNGTISVSSVHDWAAADATADVDSVQPPPWFLPLHELVFDATDRIGEGSFGAVYRGAWLDTPVVVKFMGYDDDGDARAHDLFVHEASVWHTLNHPHVVKLFGACHIGKRFFACEYAPHGTLRQYLRQCVDAIGINSSGIAANGINSSGTHINGVNADDINTSGSNAIGIVANGVNSSDTNTSIRPPSVDTNTSKHTALVWRKLYEVALGLQYLHDQGVVHNDLKCDNLLVGADHKAKITDFGLSCTAERTIQLSLHEMGALQWKAPEVLRGEAPSRASDVYGFAMCIVEAVRGDAPYGRMADVMVRLQVRKGHLPSRPAGVCDEQWSVVEMMSATDPARRVRIAFVVDKLKDISEQLALQMEVEQQVQYQVQQVQCLQDDACDSQPVHDTAVGAAAAVCSADAVAGVADSGPAPIVACDANETDTSNKSEKVEGAAAVELLQP